MTNNPRIIVIGGGAAGMMAAIVAARMAGSGARLILLERMQRVGKKLLATGNGRCNLTNINLDIRHYHGANPKFALAAFQQFNVSQTLAFFEELGVMTRTEADGKVFPLTDQATSILDVLRYEIERMGIEVIGETNVLRVYRQGEGFVCVCGEGREFVGDRVILAAGGKSSPNLGSNGGGFKIAEALNHRIEKPFPALVQVKLDAPFLKQLAGVRFQGEAEALVDGEPQRREKGELLFTDYGLSGLPILELSRTISAALDGNKQVSLRLDLFPEIEEEELKRLITRRIEQAPYKPTAFSFIGLLQKRLIQVVLKEAGIGDTQALCSTLTPIDIQDITTRLKNWRLHPTGTQSWMFSQVTAGGVDVHQVNDQTMESRLVPGLFFAGEVLDIDGDCGGYNLQWAWSSGYVAGTHAAGASLP